MGGTGTFEFDYNVVLAVLAQFAGPFYTKDVSCHPDMLAGHREQSQRRQYHAMVGKYLKQLRTPDGLLVLQDVRSGRSRGRQWQKVTHGTSAHTQATETPVLPSRASSIPATGGTVVRAGHFRTVKYMKGPEFTRIKSLLESYPEIGGVYFRPANNGVTMVDLHPDSPKPRIGLGPEPLLGVGTTVQGIEPTIPGRIAWLQQQRAKQKAPSRENQFEAYIIRHAQANGLRMPGFPDRLRLIHSQWRIHMPSGGSSQFTDLIAVDLLSGDMVLIELKAKEDGSALPQVKSYLDYFQQHADELNPFFLQVAQAMGGLYACNELAALAQVNTARVGLAAWPGSTGSVIVVGLEQLGHPAAGPAEAAVLDLGPQYAGDTALAARMRRHQSWYRMAVLKVPCGTGPRENDTSRYGNMLRKEDGCKGLNFLSPRIFAVVQGRIAQRTGGVEPFRLQCNMLSSQPMCFNLFGPLAADLSLATDLWQVLLPGEVDQVTRVLLEYAPAPASDYLADKTAFDAFVEYRRPDGLAFTGIETKLTEAFSPKPYDRPEYRQWMLTPRSPWRREAEDHVANVEHNQLWRDHLLAVAMLQRSGSPYAAGRLMLVRHSEDAECAMTTAGYRSLLKDGDDTFLDMPLDRLMAAWGTVVMSQEWQDWLVAFRLRYLDLHCSQ